MFKFLSLAILLWLSVCTQSFAQPAASEAMQEIAVSLELANSYYQTSKHDQAIEAGSRALALQEQFLPENDPAIARTLIFIAKAHSSKGFYLEAMPFLDRALVISKIHFGENSTEVAAIMGDQGRIHLYSGKYALAISTLEQALAIEQKIKPPQYNNQARICQTLGSWNRNLKKYDQALYYYNLAVDMRIKSGDNASGSMAWCYSDIGEVYLAKFNYAQALTFFQKSSDLVIKLGGADDPDYGYICNNLGRAVQGTGHFAEAVHWQKKALNLMRKNPGPDNMEIAAVLLYLGRAQVANGEYRAAIASFDEDQAITRRLLGMEATLVFHAQAGKADAYFQLFRSEGQDSLLERSRENFHMAEKNIEKRMQKETLPQAQRKLLVDAVPIFEKAMRVEKFAWEKFNQPEALQKTWQLSESMHSYLLYAATQESDARHFAGIPDEELLRDSVLRAETTELEKTRQSLIEDDKLSLSDSTVLALNAQISAKKEESLSLSARFEKQYPAYFKLKYDLKTANLTQAQQLLLPGQTLLEYYTGDTSIFVFVLHRDDSRVVELPRDFPLADWVHSLREGIVGYHTSPNPTPALYEKMVRQYAEKAQQLYAKLLLPIAEFLSDELIIIPGDDMNDLPFEVLLPSLPRDLSNFSTYDFVMRHRNIHYAYSATMLQQMSSRRHQTPTAALLALAPFFRSDTSAIANRLTLSPLPYSKEEIERVQKQVPGTALVLSGQNASKKQFLELAGKYKILHLATHGKANHQEGDFSYLAFATNDPDPEKGLLSVGELYNCKLSAELVVLSACETGIGEEQRGEGVVSLARAFAFAGAKSIVSSLWSVNDQSTMLVMDDFYAQLKSGKRKNLALNAAKQHYLEQYPGKTSHPFFWAGFVAVGDMSALKN